MLSNCGAGEDSWSPLDCKEIKPVNPKGNQPWIFSGRTEAEFEASILWLPDEKSGLTGKDLMLEKTEGKRRGWQRMRWLDSITNSLDMNLSKLGDNEEQGSLTCCSPWGCRVGHDLTTEKHMWVLSTSFFFFLTLLHGIWDLCSPARNWTCTPCVGSVEF